MFNNVSSNLRPASRNLSAARASAGRDAEPAVAGHEGEAPPIQSLRSSKESFLARLARWLGGGGSSTSQEPAHPDELKKLRPPATGRISFFFGRLSGLSREQLASAETRHVELRGKGAGSPAVAASELPTRLAGCLGLGAKDKPDGLFDRVCGLWTAPGVHDVPALQQECRAFLRGCISLDDGLAKISKALTDAHPGQRSAQVRARAQAVYAALVGSVHQHDATHPAAGVAAASPRPLEALTQRLQALAGRPGSPATLLERVRDLVAIKTGLDTLAADLGADTLGGLQTQWQALCTALQAELDGYLSTEGAAFAALKLPVAISQMDATQARLDGLREAGDLLRGVPGSDLPAPVLQASDALAASLQDSLDAVARSGGVLDRYEAIKDRELSGAERSPCATLARYLREQTVAGYRAVQDPIDALCALADPADHVDLLATLGTGVLSPQGEVLPNLVRQVRDGDRAAVDPILRDAQWDSLVGALKLAAVDRREQAERAGATTSQARAGITDKFAKEWFATRIIHQRRVLNNEINRLIAEKNPSLRLDLVGDAGASPGATEATIEKIRKAGGGLSRQVDVLLVNWIYCSCLDVATMQINPQRVQELCAALRGSRTQVPGLDDAQKLLEQGFRNFAAVKDVHQRINGFAQVLAEAKMLADASHAHDPRVRAQGLAMELRERLVGPAGGAAASVSPAQRIKDRVEAARQDWVAAVGPKATRLLTEVKRRDSLRAGLEGRQWKFESTPEELISAKIPQTHVSRADQLKVLVQCLEIVALINEQKALRTPQSTQLAADLEKHELRPLAARLTHFDIATRSFRATAGAAPQLGELQRLVGQRGDLAGLLNVSESVSKLSYEMSKPTPQSDALAQVVEAVVRVAVLEEAVANNSANFQMAVEDSTIMPVDRIRARLADYGLESSDPIPTISRMVQQVSHQVTREKLDMASLCERLDPVDPGAAGVVQRDVPGSIRFASDWRGLVARGRAMLGAPQVRQRLDNEHAVKQRFASLEPGWSFGIQVGQRGEVTVDAPLPPGVSAEVTASFEYSRGIKISRQEADRYEVDIVGTVSAGVTGTASALAGAVEASAGGGADAGKGFRISCESREQAVELVEALVGIRQLDRAGWSGGKVQELQVKKAQVHAQFNAKFEMDSPLDTPLFSIEAQLAAAASTQLEVTRSFLQREERRTEERSWRAAVSADILDGLVTGEAERGSTVRVTRTCRRVGILLKGQPGLSVRAHVLSGDAKANLQRAMPLLKGEELHHYAKQVSQAQEAAEASGHTVDVELECAMSPEGVRRANQWTRLAAERLRAPGQPPERARAGAKEALVAADREMRDPANYVIRGLHAVLYSASEAVEETQLPVKQTARVAGEQRQALQPWSGGGCLGMSLPDESRYQSLLGTPGKR